MDDNGISGLEEDELNLENFLIEEKDDDAKSSYEKTYMKLISELSDFLENNKKELSIDHVS